MCMRIELGAVIFQQTADSAEFSFDSGGVVRSHGASHSKQRFTSSCAILMENENREDIAEKHSARDERYASQDQYALRRASARDEPETAVDAITMVLVGSPGVSPRLAKCRHDVLGKQVLRLDAFPMFQSAKIGDDS